MGCSAIGLQGAGMTSRANMERVHSILRDAEDRHIELSRRADRQTAELLGAQIQRDLARTRRDFKVALELLGVDQDG